MAGPVTSYPRYGYAGMAKEGTPGTGATPTTFFKLERGLINTGQALDFFRNGNNQDISGGVKTAWAPKGSFQTMFYMQDTGFLFAAIMGTDTKTGSGDPYSHALSFAASPLLVSCELGYANNQHIQRVVSAYISRLQLEAEVNKRVMVTADVVGLTVARQSSAATVTFNDGAADGPAVFHQGAVTITGPTDASTINGTVSKVTLVIDRGIEPFYGIGSLVPIGLQVTTRLVDVTFDAVFTSDSLHRLANLGGTSGSAPSGTLGTGTFEIKLTTQASPEHSADFVVAAAIFQAAELPEISPDGKTAKYTNVKLQPYFDGTNLPLTATIKNALSTAYTA